MIERDVKKELLKAASNYSVVALLGPRQSGKTTVLKSTFSDYKYVLLEDPDMLDFALSDPRGFLKQYSNEKGLIIDEAQNAPQLFSYLQGIVDQNNVPGKFILSGSQNFYMNEHISQSLAGRICILTLLPLALSEMKNAEISLNRYEGIIFRGQYPKLYTNDIEPNQWYLNYIQTYIERDIRQIKNVTDLHLFQKFTSLCAGRIGQLLNLSELARDCGITTKTATSWISILEASYLIYLLYPHHQNFNKRIVKSPKLYFYDTGVACAFLRIKSQEQLYTHYLKGSLFESFMISELIKQDYNRGRRPDLYFWRDQSGHEIDCLLEQNNELIPIEIKSSETINAKFFDDIRYWSLLAQKNPSNGFLIYGGSENQKRTAGQVLSWTDVDSIVN